MIGRRRPAAVLTIVQACKLLGMDPATDRGAPTRLRRMMADQERHARRPIWPRAGKRMHGKGTRLRCTMPLLHLHLPHLFDVRAELPQAIEERFRDLATEQQNARHKINVLGARITRLESALRVASATLVRRSTPPGRHGRSGSPRSVDADPRTLQAPPAPPDHPGASAARTGPTHHVEPARHTHRRSHRRQARG